MSTWSKNFEEELTIILKDWLKHHGKTQADLKQSLQASSTRMPSLLEVLEREYRLGGLHRLLDLLCSIEASWISPSSHYSQNEVPVDPFGQLDLLLERIRDDCTN